MMPTPSAGVKPWNGNMNPVMLVAAVVSQKKAVIGAKRLAASSPYRTTKPAPIAARLIATWIKVKVARSKSIVRLPLEFEPGPTVAQRVRPIRSFGILARSFGKVIRWGGVRRRDGSAVKILVTGSSGHLGEALVRTLQSTSHEIAGVDLIESPFTSHVGSIADRAFVRRCMHGVGAVLHTATLHKPHVGTHSRQDFVDTNVTGTLHLL